MTVRPPYSSFYDLEKLTAKGFELVLKPTAPEREKIAAWLDVVALENLEAVVKLTRAGSGRYSYRGQFEADVVQACVVTLEPVPSHLAGDFERSFQFARVVSHSGRKGKKPAIAPVGGINDLDSDEPELLESPVVDLAAPMLEELSLSLDPYPRKAGVEFTQPEEAPAEDEENPFAVLARLKGS
jgi:uncharacterized metal-binding protein YceD (DUF177 family)